MKKIGLVFGVVLITWSLAFPPSAKAIIFLPAILLIPIAKIVAVFIGITSFPILTISALVAYFKKHSVAEALLIGLGLLILVGILVMVVLKFVQPDRPWI